MRTNSASPLRTAAPTERPLDGSSGVKRKEAGKIGRATPRSTDLSAARRHGALPRPQAVDEATNTKSIRSSPARFPSARAKCGETADPPGRRDPGEHRVVEHLGILERYGTYGQDHQHRRHAQPAWSGRREPEQGHAREP